MESEFGLMRGIVYQLRRDGGMGYVYYGRASPPDVAVRAYKALRALRPQKKPLRVARKARQGIALPPGSEKRSMSMWSGLYATLNAANPRSVVGATEYSLEPR